MKTKSLFLEGKKITGSFLHGFWFIFSSFKIIKENKGLITYFIVPFLLNIFILSGVFYFSYTVIEPEISGAITGSEWYMDVLRFVVAPIVMLVLGLITILIYSILGNIITAPFNDFLSMKVEQKLTDAKFDEPFTIQGLVADITRMASNIVKLLGLLVIVNIASLLVNLIPLIGNIIYPVLSFMATAFFLGFQFFDFPLERRKLNFKEKLRITWSHKLMTIGLGTGFFLVSFVPIVGFLGLNLASIGATTLFIDHIKPVLKITSGE